MSFGEKQMREWDNQRRVRRIRQLRGILKSLEEYDEKNFHQRFRLRKDSVIRLTDILKNSLQYQTRRGLPLLATSWLALLVDAGAIPPPVMARLPGDFCCDFSGDLKRDFVAI